MGSNPATTTQVLTNLPKMLKHIEAKSLADVGAGDRIWIQHAKFHPDLHYAAYDLIPRHRVVEEFDCVQDVLPQAYDAIMVRFVLNHLSARMVRDAIYNFQASGSRYLLCTYPDPAKQKSGKGHNQTSYWAGHGIVLPEPVYDFQDFGKWHMGAFELERIEYPIT